MSAYSEQRAPASHDRWVECGWCVTSDAELTGYRVPPDGCLDIVYDRSGGLQLVGAMTKEQQFDFRGKASLAGVRFRPGMAAGFLGASLRGAALSEFTDRSVALEDLWSGKARELKRRLDDANSIRDAMRILLGNLGPPVAAPNPVQQAIEAMAAANGNADLDSLAWQANLSARQFRRRCLDETGLTPKRLSRVLRFRYVCRMAENAARPDWAAIALEAEYFDQAHLIRDFHEFTGKTPMAVFSNTRPGGPG